MWLDIVQSLKTYYHETHKRNDRRKGKILCKGVTHSTFKELYDFGFSYHVDILTEFILQCLTNLHYNTIIYCPGKKQRCHVICQCIETFKLW